MSKSCVLLFCSVRSTRRAAVGQEHVTPYIHKHPEWFRVEHVKGRRIFPRCAGPSMNRRISPSSPRSGAELYPNNPAFDTAAVLALTRTAAELVALNGQFLR